MSEKQAEDLIMSSTDKEAEGLTASSSTSGEAVVQVERASGFDPTVQLLFELTGVEPFSGGTVALASHPLKPQLFVSILELGKVLVVCTETSTVLSTLEVPEDFDEGPKNVAFDAASGCLALMVDDCLTRWRCDGSTWTELRSARVLREDFESCD
ncbi:unnamed protein product, partial [Polarella glacialis]